MSCYSRCDVMGKMGKRERGQKMAFFESLLISKVLCLAFSVLSHLILTPKKTS